MKALKATRAAGVAAGGLSLASFEASVWTSGDLQQRLLQQAIFLMFAAFLSIFAWFE